MRKDQVHAEGQAFSGETAAAARAERAAPTAPAGKAGAAARGGGGAWKGLVIAALVVLLCGVVFAVCFWKKAVSVAVVSQTWEREVQIEQLAARSESSWCDQLPSGAMDVSRSREVRSQRQVKDGETCASRRKDNGDGTFKQVQECSPKYRSEPVYDERCSYKVNKWAYERSEKASGRSINEPRVWPVVRLGRTGSSVGAEREGARKATYRVTFGGVNGKEGRSCELDEPRWATFTVGSTWQGSASALTGSLDCGSLKPAK